MYLDSIRLVQILSDRPDKLVCAAGQRSNFPLDCSVPRGSFMGPRCFVSYTEDVVDTGETCSSVRHLYAYDTTPADLKTLTHCAFAYRVVQTTLSMSRRLQLNTNKTETIQVGLGSKSSLARLSSRHSAHEPSTVVRDLNVHCRTVKQHVAKVAAFYHLRRLRQIRRRVGGRVATRLVLALIITRLDYCNSLL